MPRLTLVFRCANYPDKDFLMAIETIKFSEFTNGGDLEPNQITVGLEASANTRFSNPFPLLPPGSTGDRPAPAAAMYYRLRFNTTNESYEYYSPTLVDWIELEDSENVLPKLASHLAGEGASLIGLENQGTVVDKTVQDMAENTFICQTNNGTLVNAQFLDLLATGIIRNATGTGVLSILTDSSTIDAVINDDTMATAATTNLSTSLAIKNYVDSVAGGLVDSVTGVANQVDVDNTDPANPIVSLSATIDTPGTFTIGTTIILDSIIDDDTFATATDTNIPTSESVKAYVDALVPSAIPLPGGDGTFIIADTGAWITSDVTLPNALTANDILYASATNVVSGLNSVARSVMTTNASGVPTWIALADGELVIGSTAGSPAAATLTAGSGISISEGSNTITISGVAAGLGWNTDATGTIAMATDTAYVCSNAGATTGTLPATAPLGSVCALEGLGAGGWVLTANTGQTIKIGSSTTSSGGTLTSAAATDNVYVVCIVANTTWRVQHTNSAGLTVA
jgi:hypothetical protein